jgi:hypothetical protein
MVEGAALEEPERSLLRSLALMGTREAGEE